MAELISYDSDISGACTIKLFRPLVTNLRGAPIKGRPLALPSNIRLSWKGLPGTNTLAYYENP
jgi:hypothetical protein